MYNKQLDAFVKAADETSFTRAAKLLYIAPASLIQQINLLESNLGVKLFDRSPRGVSLTEAGKSLYEDALEIMQLSQIAIHRAQSIQDGSQTSIRIGTSLLTKCRYLNEAWSHMIERNPETKIELVALKSPGTSDWKPLLGLGRDYDMLEGLFLSELHRGKCEFYEIERVPLCPAVPAQHPLFSRSELTLEDLSGQTVALMSRGESHDFDAFRNALEQLDDVTVIDAPHYDMSVFSLCEMRGYILITPANWQDIHPALSVKPIDAEFTIPYGVEYATNLSKQARLFLDVIKSRYPKKN